MAKRNLFRTKKIKSTHFTKTVLCSSFHFKPTSDFPHTHTLLTIFLFPYFTLIITLTWLYHWSRGVSWKTVSIWRGKMKTFFIEDKSEKAA